MFEVGFQELVLIFGWALLVLGPERLPGLVQKIGRWTGRARAMARQLRTQLEHEVTLEELSRSSSKRTPPREPAGAEPQAVQPQAPNHDAASTAPDAAAQGLGCSNEPDEKPARTATTNS